jgi:hypothetical protein
MAPPSEPQFWISPSLAKSLPGWSANALAKKG